jgi:hypothetical protein
MTERRLTMTPGGGTVRVLEAAAAASWMLGFGRRGRRGWGWRPLNRPGEAPHCACQAGRGAGRSTEPGSGSGPTRPGGGGR